MAQRRDFVRNVWEGFYPLEITHFPMGVNVLGGIYMMLLTRGKVEKSEAGQPLEPVLSGFSRPNPQAPQPPTRTTSYSHLRCASPE